MAKENLTKSADLQVAAREIDFVTRFARNWEHLREIMGIMRPIRKEPGAVLKSKTATLVLQDGNIPEGDEIPYSKAEIHDPPYQEMTIEKYAKAVSIESIKDHGYDVAVQMTDDAFLFELQTNVTGRFYTYLNTGKLTGSYENLQMAIAMAKGAVENRFKQMHRTVTGVVGFANIAVSAISTGCSIPGRRSPNRWPRRPRTPSSSPGLTQTLWLSSSNDFSKHNFITEIHSLFRFQRVLIKTALGQSTTGSESAPGVSISKRRIFYG